ncbi:MAG: pyrrolo-quinoline quinone [Eubacteriales bacterium]|jgi:outer membrane protein assembly factor BamB|nr:pyrrolo-quinoline quinone [Eubacteriales bacterium]
MSQVKKKKKKSRRRKLVFKPRFYAVLAVFVVALGLLFLLIATLLMGGSRNEQQVQGGQPEQTEQGSWIKQLFSTASPTPTPEPTPTPVPTPSPTPEPTPYCVAESNPEKYGYVGHIEVDGTEVSTYERTEKIRFGSGDSYSRVPGVLCFRGNNYRDLSGYGAVNLSENKMTVYQEVKVDKIKKGRGFTKGYWSGCGWTGQPLIVKWESDVRQMMNLYDWAKAKEDLVEVIYPTEDGNIYFFDLESGKETRDKLVMKMPFKGTGTVDPRGYPLLYVGSGDEYDEPESKARAMVINLLTGQKIYELGLQDSDSFAKRHWYAYDSAPLIDEKTDTLIWPGENGILYTVKLNTNFDRQNGIISVNPGNMVKFRYDSNISYTALDKADSTHKWLGYEGSAAVWNGFIYLSSNDGLFQCIDLNTMQIKWVADTLDDTNASPVLDVISDTEAYLYVGTSLHFTQDSRATGVTPFFKINAMTGEIVGQYGKTVETVSGVSGGIQDTAVVGKNNLSDLVFVNFARCGGGKDKGVLVALHKDTMTEAWSMPLDHYSWSSPAVVYNTNGNGYIIQADSGGHIYLIDGRTGTVLDTIQPTESNFEASPALYGNYMVVGCRGDQKIFFIRLS